MSKEILSLKSIYKFLTSNDYPIYSEGIIKKDNRTGLTLTKFCHENILIDFKNRKCGKIIWRTEGGRNRYVSEICNRSNRLSVYGEYAEEIAAAADAETVWRQICQLAAFLSERQFNADAFYKKLPAYIDLFRREDDAFSEDAAVFFACAVDEYREIEGKGRALIAVYCGWVLTFLILHALMGNGEGEKIARRLRANGSLSLSEMIKKYSQESERKAEVAFLTGANTELSCPPLKTGHFFGRESEIFELREMLMQGGAYLISGMGGIGKTELMRQFLMHCTEEALVDYICVVQYEGGLAKSLVKAFPEIHGADLSENFKEALAKIRVRAGKRVLIIVDNMDGGVDDAELEAFCGLPAAIFITSRHQSVKGLKTYRLKPIGKKAGSLIFRDNYGSRLSDEDKQALEDIVDNELWCHTLTLRLLAKTARNNHWTLAKLQEQLKAGVTPTGYTGPERYEDLKQVYAQMYAASKITREQNALLRMFAALPYRSYTTAFADLYLRGFLHENDNMEEQLEKLWSGGWLDRSEERYSMHPFIAECILSTPLTEAECAPFVRSIVQAWEKMGRSVGARLIPEILYESDRYMELDPELAETTMLIRAVSGKLAGKFSESHVKLFLIAIALEGIYDGVSKAGLETLEKVRAKVAPLSAETSVGMDIMLCSLNGGDADVLNRAFENIRHNDEIAETLKYTFADVLGTRFYHMGKPDMSEQFGRYIIDNCDRNSIRMAACQLFANVKIQNGDFAGYGEWLKRGIEIGHSSGRKNGKDMQLLLSQMCDLYMAMGNFADAERTLNELETISDNNTYFVRQQVVHRRGCLAMYRGDQGFGVEELGESRRLSNTLYSGGSAEELSHHAMVCVDYAMALNKAKQFDESAERYQEALAIYNRLPGHDFEKHRILNNMSVMYLDRSMPETALNYLPEAYERAKVLGGLALGETANNLAKAWRALGDREKELVYLKEAAPILEQFYGGEHPKVIAARERLSEIG